MNPTIKMPELAEGSNYCAGEPIDLSGVVIGNPDRVEWRTRKRPAGGELFLSADDVNNVVGTPNTNGNYTVDFCTYYSEGPENVSAITGPFTNCPYSWPAGSSFPVEISDYGDAVAFEWFIFNATLNTTTGETVRVQTQDAPTTITLVVHYTDIDGVQGIVTCNIETYTAAELVYTESESICFDAIKCQNTCFCDSETFYVGCDEGECLELCIDINPQQPPRPLPTGKLI